MPEPKEVTVEVRGDDFAHAWAFNRFRLESIDDSPLLILALVSDGGTSLAVNAVSISGDDLERSKKNVVEYLQKVGDVAGDDDIDRFILTGAPPPARVYPVNHMNLARMERTAEFCFYRYSIHSLLTAGTTGQAKVPCYPVVLFRCDLDVQLALLKSLFA